MFSLSPLAGPFLQMNRKPKAKQQTYAGNPAKGQDQMTP